MRELLKTSILLVLFFLWVSSSIAQTSELNAIDSFLDSTFRINGKSKKIVKGTRRTGTAYFFLKKSGKLLWVQSRRQYKTGKKLDSSAVFFYYYLNDSLLKTVHHRYIYKNRKHISGYTYLYFRNDRLIEKSEEGDAPISNIDLIIREANAHMKHSYKITKKGRYKKSSQLKFG